MELISGNIFIRMPHEAMQKDQVVLGHKHNFDHTTFCTRGALELCLLDVETVNAHGLPLDAKVAEVFVLKASDDINFQIVMKGRYHTIRALEDGTRYQCVYAHRAPQAISIEDPGQRHQEPYTKRDADGVLWVRVDESIVQDAAGWTEAYR